MAACVNQRTGHQQGAIMQRKRNCAALFPNNRTVRHATFYESTEKHPAFCDAGNSNIFLETAHQWAKPHFFTAPYPNRAGALISHPCFTSNCYRSLPFGCSGSTAAMPLCCLGYCAGRPAFTRQKTKRSPAFSGSSVVTCVATCVAACVVACDIPRK